MVNCNKISLSLFKFLLLICLSLPILAQIHFSSPPIDSVRVEVARYYDYHNRLQETLLSYDSIDVNHLFQNGTSSSVDSLFTSKPSHRIHTYDSERRLTRFLDWTEINGQVQINNEEAKTYNSKGQISYHIPQALFYKCHKSEKGVALFYYSEQNE